MTTEFDVKPDKHLMHLVTTRNGMVPNFALLLGAGASATSGVRTAQDMIDEWRSLLFDRSDGSQGYRTWLAQQPWFEHADEYSTLFELIYDEPSQRRVYIEECIKDAHPGWGYIYLTDLLANRFFDVVFTTNFDDLLNEACYLYTEKVRPIMAAHDSAVQGIRVTSDRPKIIKLHGDFLYDNIKNTVKKLETLEANTKRKLSQFAQEYGLIVLGYGGRDRSVMDTLELLLRDEEYYKQGVYWCIRRGTTPSDRLRSLVKRNRVRLVEVEGFDQFIADLHQTASLNLPKPIAQPFEMVIDRGKLFANIDTSLMTHSVIGTHVREFLRTLDTHQPKPPLTVEAAALTSIGQPEEAALAWKRAYAENPQNMAIAHEYADALVASGDHEQLSAFIFDSPLSDSDKAYFLLRIGENHRVIEVATSNLAQRSTDRRFGNFDRAVVRINRAIALKRLGRISEMKSDLDYMELNDDTSDARLRAGIAALRGDKKAMFAALAECLHTELSPTELEIFPVFEDYREDPEFLELINSNSA